MQGGPTLADIIIGLLPIVVLFGLIGLLIQRLSAFMKHQKEIFTRQTAALERIASALEKKP